MSAPVGYVSPTGEPEALRPHSVRILELQALRKNRPYSAANRGTGSANRYLKTRKEADRARPRLIQYRKEDLYDERMLLKTRANELADENLKLKTRIKFLEKEGRREDSGENTSILSGFKAQCKELKSKLEEKDGEVKELRRNMKATRATEMQVELKAYIDECTRLRRMVEESAEQLAMGVAPVDLQERYLQLLVEYKTLTREYRVVIGNQDDSKGRKPKDQTTRNNATIFELREENVALKDQNRSLVGELTRLQQIMTCPHCQQPLNMGSESLPELQRPVQLLFHMVWAKMKEMQMDVQTLWHKLDSEMAGVLRPQEIEEGFALLGIQLTGQELSKIMREMNPEQGTRVHFAQFELTLMKHSLDPENLPEELTHALTQLAWQCQVSRIQKEEVGSILTTGAECGINDLTKSLQQVPFNLSLETSQCLAEFLLHGEPSQSSHIVSVSLGLVLPEWQIFSEEEEAELDRTLMKLFHGKYDRFLELCAKFDPGETQHIKFEEFMEVCTELGVDVQGALGDYLKVEFYSETKDVDCVPYPSVAQLYCGGVQETEE